MLDSSDLVVGKRVRCLYPAPSSYAGKIGTIVKITHNSGTIDHNKFDIEWDDGSIYNTENWSKLSSFEIVNETQGTSAVEDTALTQDPANAEPVAPSVPVVCPFHYYGIGSCVCKPVYLDKQMVGQKS